MAKQRKSAATATVEVYSEWVRIDPVTGRLIDEAALADPAAARLDTGDGTVRLKAAKNEYVSFQVVVASGSRIGEIKLGFGGLAGPRGRKIGKASFEPHVQWYHDMGEKIGWVPDALVPVSWLEKPVGLPWKRCGVPKQTVQGFWVDLFIPKDAVKGKYAGKLTVSLDGDKHAIPIVVDVWPFAIGDECSQVADMNAYGPCAAGGWEDLAVSATGENTAAYLEAERSTFVTAHEHRSMLHYLPYGHPGTIAHASFAPPLAGKGKKIHVKSWTAFDKKYAPLLDGSAFKSTRRGPIPLPFLYMPQNYNWPADFVNFQQKGYATEWQRIGAEFVDHFTAKGWTNTKFELFFNHKQRYKYYPYDGDEIRFLEDTAHMHHFHDLGKGIFDRKGGAKFIWRVDSSWVFPEHGKGDLTDFVKLWVVNSGCLSEGKENIAPMHRKGCDIFHYGGASGLDTPLSWVWMWPVRTLARRIEGFCWWQTIGWTPNIWHKHRGDKYATAMFFPGGEFGKREVVGGIRAKVMRNAMQTIEYAYALDRKRRAGTAIKLIDKVLGTDLDFWWSAGRPPRSGSDAAAIDSKILGDPLSWNTIRQTLAEALVKA